ncbi:MAG TPA: hypothetical protein VIA62_11345 [Thermoanaerobaculia bacterium]|nr:hypothetical protein [Thermoanaerobaculia bacterium]
MPPARVRSTSRPTQMRGSRRLEGASEARTWALRWRIASVRSTVSRNGCSASSARRGSKGMRRRAVSPSERTVSSRGAPSSTSFSPKISPAPSSRSRSTGLPGRSARNSTAPRSTTYRPSQASPVR